LISIKEFKDGAFLEKKNGKKEEVQCVVVQELASGGELFYYVLNSGYFS